LGNVRHNLDLPDLEDLLRDVIHSITEREREVQDKDGRWYSMRVRPYLTLDNKIDGAVLVLVDIDALKRSAREVSAARDYAEVILATVRYPLLVLNGNLRVATANAAFYKKFETSTEETEGRYIYELGKGDWNIPALRQALEEILPRDSFFDDFEMARDFDKIGQRTMLLNARRLQGGDGEGLILLAIDDITEAKQTQQLRRAQAELMRSNEELEKQIQDRTVQLRETVNELEAFSYSISHDMRAPLRSMQGFAHILLEKYSDKFDPSGRDFLQRIERSASRLDNLIRDVLSYARLVRSQAPLEPIDLDDLLRDIIDSYPEYQGIKATVQIDKPLGSVQGNQAWLTQCFANLISNAVKFVAPGVKPSVRIWAEKANPPEASEKTSATASSGWVKIWVEDNGIGIAPEDRDRIFRLFERVHSTSEYEGTGLGLTIVRKAVERMGGQMGFESEPGKGSKFWILLQTPAPASWKQ
jgi:two-component system CheB/CheR fusion protein